MQIFDRIGADDYEQVVYCHDRPSGLRAIIAIHSTVLGPALGGTRFYPYPSEDAALEDVLRLARGMTYKSAAAGLDLGGGKAVILGDPRTDRTEALIRAYGRFIDTLGRRYITAEDVGTTEADMNLIHAETSHVTGTSRAHGGSGDPSAATAYGVLWAIRAVMAHLDTAGDALTTAGAGAHPSLAGTHVVISGVGKVGGHLVRHLIDEHATVTMADIDERAIDRVRRDLGPEGEKVGLVPAEKAHLVPCDVFSPCALGGVLDADTIGELRCRAVVGAANNQLAEPQNANLLQRVGILYAPDYIANAGGVINVADELAGYCQPRAYARITRIYDTTLAVIASAEEAGITTTEAADRMAERRLQRHKCGHHIRTFTQEVQAASRQEEQT